MTKPHPSHGDVLAPELMARVNRIKLSTRLLVNEVLSGAYRSSFRGTGIEFEDVRPYMPGDDVRAIDWKRTAHGQGAFIKTYVEEREIGLSFLVDTSLSMDFGTREWTKREAAAQFCALLAHVALRSQDRVSLTLFGPAPGLHLPPSKGRSAVSRLVREVIAAEPTRGASDFQVALDHHGRTNRRHGLLFLVSDFQVPELSEPGGAPGWRDTLAKLARRHDVILVRVTDPLEERLPEGGGILPLRDVESGRRVEVDTRSKRVRAAWEAAASARCAAFHALSHRVRAATIEVSTGSSVADPVARFFHRRRRGGPQ